jgi:hypothetical protein
LINQRSAFLQGGPAGLDGVFAWRLRDIRNDITSPNQGGAILIFARDGVPLPVKPLKTQALWRKVALVLRIEFINNKPCKKILFAIFIERNSSGKERIQLCMGNRHAL